MHDAESLKDKRRVVSSLKDRLHREHMVSCAEVAKQDSMASAVLGLALVAPSGKRAADVLDKVCAKLYSLTDAELVSIDRALIHRDELDAVRAEAPEAGSEDAELLAAEMLARAVGDDTAQEGTP